MILRSNGRILDCDGIKRDKGRWLGGSLLRPEAPKGLENNWVDTRPSKGFFVWFRSYYPTEAFFDKSWSLPDIEKVQ